jgi:hypothetical protein
VRGGVTSRLQRQPNEAIGRRKELTPEAKASLAAAPEAIPPRRVSRALSDERAQQDAMELEMEREPALLAESASDDPYFGSHEFGDYLMDRSYMSVLRYGVLIERTVLEDELVTCAHGMGWSGWKDENPNNPGADVYLIAEKPSKRLQVLLDDDRVYWRDNEPWVKKGPGRQRRKAEGWVLDELRRKTLRISCKTNTSSLEPWAFDVNLLNTNPTGVPVTEDSDGRLTVDRKKARAIVEQMLGHLGRYERILVGRALPAGHEAHRVDVRYDLLEVDHELTRARLERLRELLSSRRSLQRIEQESSFRFEAKGGSVKITEVDSAAPETPSNHEQPLFSVIMRADSVGIECSTLETTRHQSFFHPAPAHMHVTLLRAF